MTQFISQSNRGWSAFKRVIHYSATLMIPAREHNTIMSITLVSDRVDKYKGGYIACYYNLRHLINHYFVTPLLSGASCKEHGWRSCQILLYHFCEERFIVFTFLSFRDASMRPDLLPQTRLHWPPRRLHMCVRAGLRLEHADMCWWVMHVGLPTSTVRACGQVWIGEKMPYTRIVP